MAVQKRRKRDKKLYIETKNIYIEAGE